MIYPHVKYLGPAYPERRDPTAVRELLSRVNDGIRGRKVRIADTQDDHVLATTCRRYSLVMDVPGRHGAAADPLDQR